MTQATDDDAVDAARPLSAFEERLRAWQATSERRFEARLAANDVLELSMLDSIGYDWWSGGGITSKSVQAKLDANKSAKTIKLLLNSPGGDAFEGLAIQAILKRHGARVEVEIVGLAASAASVIAMAGDSIAMHEGSLFMVHEPWTCMCGDSSDMRSTADFLDKVNESALAVYTRRTGRARDEIAALVADETWMTAQEAVDQKFATSVIHGTSAEPKTKARAEASRVFMSMRKPRMAARPVVSTEPPAVEPTEPVAAPALETTPALTGSAVTQTPSAGKEKVIMTATQNSFPTTIAIALGLPAGSSESDIQASLGRLRDLERDVLAISGVSIVSEAVGTIRGFKAKAESHDKMAAELSTVKAERDKQNFETLIANGKTEGKLVPVTAKHYEEKFANAVANGRSEEFVNELRGFLAVAPRVLPQVARQVASSVTSTSPGTWNGKTYADLKPMEKDRLSREDPELFALMRREHQQSVA